MKKDELMNKYKELKGQKEEAKKEVDQNKPEDPRYLVETRVAIHNIKMTMPDKETLDKESVGRSVGAAVLAEYLKNNAAKVSLGFQTNVAKSEFEPKRFGELAAQSMVMKGTVDTAAKAWSWFSSEK